MRKNYIYICIYYKPYFKRNFNYFNFTLLVLIRHLNNIFHFSLSLPFDVVVVVFVYIIAIERKERGERRKGKTIKISFT